MPNRTVRRKPQVKGAGFVRNAKPDDVVHIRFGPVYGDRKKVAPKRRRAPNAAERQRINIVNQVNLHFDRALGGEYMPRRPGGFGPLPGGGGGGAPPQPPYQPPPPPAHYPRPGGGGPPPNGPPPDVPPDLPPGPPGTPGGGSPAPRDGSPATGSSPGSPHWSPGPGGGGGGGPSGDGPPGGDGPSGGGPSGPPRRMSADGPSGPLRSGADQAPDLNPDFQAELQRRTQAHADAANAQLEGLRGEAGRLLAERDERHAQADAAFGQERAAAMHEAAVLGARAQAAETRANELQARIEQQDADVASNAQRAAEEAQTRSQADAATQARMGQQQQEVDAARAETAGLRAERDALRARADASEGEARAAAMQAAAEVGRREREAAARQVKIEAESQERFQGYVARMGDDAGGPSNAPPPAPPPAPAPASHHEIMVGHPPAGGVPNRGLRDGFPAPLPAPAPAEPSDGSQPMSPDVRRGVNMTFSGDFLQSDLPDWSGNRSGAPSPSGSGASMRSDAPRPQSSIHSDVGSWSPMGSGVSSIPEGEADAAEALAGLHEAAQGGAALHGLRDDAAEAEAADALAGLHEAAQGGAVLHGLRGDAAEAEAAQGLMGIQEQAHAGAALHRMKRQLSRENSNDAQAADRAMPMPRYGQSPLQNGQSPFSNGSDVAGPSGIAREDSPAYRSASHSSSQGSSGSLPRGRDSAFDHLFQPAVVAMEPSGSGGLPRIPSGSRGSSVSHPSRLFSSGSDSGPYSSVQYAADGLGDTSASPEQYDGGFFSPTVPDPYA